MNIPQPGRREPKRQCSDNRAECACEPRMTQSSLFEGTGLALKHFAWRHGKQSWKAALLSYSRVSCGRTRKRHGRSLSLALGRTVNRNRSPRLKASGRQNNVGKGSRQIRSVTSGKGLAPRAHVGVGGEQPLGFGLIDYCGCGLELCLRFPMSSRDFPMSVPAMKRQLGTVTNKRNPTG